MKEQLNADGTITLTFELEEELYYRAKEILEAQGYTIEEAVVLFIKAVVACGTIPFPVTAAELAAARAMCGGDTE